MRHTNQKAFSILSLFVGIFLLFSLPLSATIYYVDKTTGDDGDTGLTEELAWETIAKVSATEFSAGDSVLFKRGEEWRDATLNIISTGSSGNLITFGAYGSGANPIINGADLITTWTEYGGEALKTLDFEEGDTTDWTDTSVFNSGVVDAHADALHTGSYGSRHYVPAPGSTDRRAYGEVTLGSTYTEWYWIGYLKISDLTMADGDEFEALIKAKSSGNDAFRIEIKRSGADYQLNGVGIAVFTTTISKTEWVKVEVYFKAETGSESGDGIIRVWVDDSLEYEQTNDTGTYNETWQLFEHGFRYLLDDGTYGYLYLDDMEFHDGMPGQANVWQAACTTEPNVVWFDDTLGTAESSIANLDAVREWYWTGDVLYVYSTSDPDDAYTDPGIEAGARTNVVTISIFDYIKLEYLTIRHSNSTGIYVADGSTYCEFDNLLLEYNQWRNGIVFEGSGTDNNTVTNCIARYNGDPGNEAGGGFIIVASSASNTFEDCESYNNSEDGFAIGGDETVNEANVGGINNVFRRCNSHDNEEDGFDLKQGPNTIEYCTADSNLQTGIVFHQFAEQVTIRYNIITNCVHGIYTTDGEEVSAGGDYIYYNVVGLKASGGNQALQLNANGPIYLYNNVIYAPSCSGNSCINLPGGANNGVYFKNNIVYVTGNTAIWCQAADTFDFDNNCFYRTNAGDTWKWTGTGYDTIAGWRTASSQDASSINSDPLMLDPANDDFRVKMASPCVDAGTDVSLTTDYRGRSIRHAPDIGAYEDPTNAVFMTRLFNYLKE